MKALVPAFNPQGKSATQMHLRCRYWRCAFPGRKSPEGWPV